MGVRLRLLWVSIWGSRSEYPTLVPQKLAESGRTERCSPNAKSRLVNFQGFTGIWPSRQLRPARLHCTTHVLPLHVPQLSALSVSTPASRQSLALPGRDRLSLSLNSQLSTLNWAVSQLSAFPRHHELHPRNTNGRRPEEEPPMTLRKHEWESRLPYRLPLSASRLPIPPLSTQLSASSPPNTDPPAEVDPTEGVRSGTGGRGPGWPGGRCPPGRIRSGNRSP